jgi:two-component system sensor histidine kinase KdpD
MTLSFLSHYRLHPWRGLAVALATIALCVVVSDAMLKIGFALPNVYMVFLLGVVFVSTRHGAGYGVLAALCSVCALAFFFMPPILSLAVSDVQQVFGLVALSTIGVAISGLTAQIRRQARDAQHSATRLDSLYRLSRELADLSGDDPLAWAAVRHIEATFGGRAAVLLPTAGNSFRIIPEAPPLALNANELEAAEISFRQNVTAGLGTPYASQVRVVCVPLASRGGPLGVLVYRLRKTESALSDDQQQLMRTFAHQVAGAMERDRLSTEVRAVQGEVENERLRSALLSSVSHDLRTPLAVVVGASSSLIEDHAQLDAPTRDGLYQTIFEHSNRLSRIVDNLLNMTQLESGVVTVTKQSHVLEEVVGSTLHTMADILQGRKIETDLATDLPLVPLDAILFQQVLFNLLDNAIKYDRSGMPIEIRAFLSGPATLVVEVSDHGPGIGVGQEQRVFEKFFRGSDLVDGQRGSGLGLTICRAIVTAHGGTITAENASHGGATFRIQLPLNTLAGS